MMYLTMAADVAELQRGSILHWEQHGFGLRETGCYKAIEENHGFNFQLWHAEDRARREDMGPEFVYKAKREIDHFNQQRNNRMEQIDTWVFNELEPVAPSVCPVHSETPGMMIDRLSILALKTYYMGIQATRTGVDDVHQQTCLAKLNVIHEQKTQLQQCLHQLLEDVVLKKRTFRVYHQFKMYNDPSLNPQLYSGADGAG